ncbi:winged helix-turn-helix domain-containing protein, partial [Pseudomonas poae]|uniref:winged helix-turn-helix domain-containing protein n=1 Tax=Pseudomonas poae TaxID=200451 RepID=UPI001F22EC96
AQLMPYVVVFFFCTKQKTKRESRPTVRWAGRCVKKTGLARHEFRLLQSLLEQPERVFSREQLLDAVGVPADAGYERNIDTHIKSLRSKLRSVAAQAEPIQTHRGLGYSYSPGNS